MKPRIRFLLRLTAPPSLAVAIVLGLTGITLLDLSRKQTAEEGERDVAPRVQGTEGPVAKARVPLGQGVPELSEEDALRTLAKAPTWAAVARLWKERRHRERLFKVLLQEGTFEEVRLFLLGAFEREDRAKAVEAARSILAEKEVPEGPLLLTALEILSRHGGKQDLGQFSARPGESHQLKTLREEYRASLSGRLE